MALPSPVRRPAPRPPAEEQPGQVAQLHRNAAAWYEEHGLAEDAIRHAVAAGEMTWAARLIEQHFDTVSGLRGEGATIQRWLSALPGRPGPVPSPAAAGAGPAGRRRPRGRGGALGRRGRARPGRRGGGAVRAPAGPGGSLLVNIPALIAVHHSLLAMLRGDAEATDLFASRALAERTRASGCWSTWPGQPGHSGLVPRPAGRGRARLRASIAGWGRQAHHHGLGGTHSARSSSPGAAWTRPPGRASRPWSHRRAGRRRQPPARRTRGWPRWPTSATNSTTRCDT